MTFSSCCVVNAQESMMEITTSLQENDIGHEEKERTFLHSTLDKDSSLRGIMKTSSKPLNQSERVSHPLLFSMQGLNDIWHNFLSFLKKMFLLRMKHDGEIQYFGMTIGMVVGNTCLLRSEFRSFLRTII